MRTERYELRDVEPAPGKWRGGIGIIRANRFMGDGAFTSETDRAYEAPPGLFGGGAGSTLRLYRIDADGTEVPLESKQTNFAMPAGATLRLGAGLRRRLRRSARARPGGRCCTTGARSWSASKSAERDYGVVIDVAADAVDAEATARRRAAR